MAEVAAAISKAAESEAVLLSCCFALHSYANQRRAALRRQELPTAPLATDNQGNDLAAMLRDLDQVLPLKSKDATQIIKLQAELTPLPWSRALNCSSSEIPSWQLPYLEELVLHNQSFSREADHQGQFEPVFQRISALKAFIQRHSRNRQLCTLLKGVIRSYEATVVSIQKWPATSVHLATPKNAALLLARVSWLQVG